MAMDDTGLPGYRDSKSVLPHASQEPICLADIAWPVRDNKLACKRKCLSCMFFFSGLSTFQESVAMDRIQRIMGVLQNPCMGWVSCCFSSPHSPVTWGWALVSTALHHGSIGWMLSIYLIYLNPLSPSCEGILFQCFVFTHISSKVEFSHITCEWLLRPRYWLWGYKWTSQGNVKTHGMMQQGGPQGQ